jgi:hypothetical protein
MKKLIIMSGLSLSLLAVPLYSSASANALPMNEEKLSLTAPAEKLEEPMFWAFIGQQVGKQVGKYIGRQLIGESSPSSEYEYDSVKEAFDF